MYSCSVDFSITSIFRLVTKMKDSFNSDFYITAATVIPGLYTTLFLQSQLVRTLLSELPT
jgi:hypothetical protein